MPTLSIEKAREQLSRLPEQLAETADAQTFKITRDGKPVLAVMSWEFYESLMETLELLKDDGQLAALRCGIEEADRGQTRPWEGDPRDVYALAQGLAKKGLLKPE